MNPMTSLLADLAFGLAFVALIFLLYIIGTYHAPCESTGLATRHEDAEAPTRAEVRDHAVTSDAP
jgi:hypothetical protein